MYLLILILFFLASFAEVCNQSKNERNGLALQRVFLSFCPMSVGPFSSRLVIADLSIRYRQGSKGKGSNEKDNCNQFYCERTSYSNS
jgi:hypothetical protein